jgi:hypothetical protein
VQGKRSTLHSGTSVSPSGAEHVPGPEKHLQSPAAVAQQVPRSEQVSWVIRGSAWTLQWQPPFCSRHPQARQTQLDAALSGYSGSAQHTDPAGDHSAHSSTVLGSSLGRHLHAPENKGSQKMGTFQKMSGGPPPPAPSRDEPPSEHAHKVAKVTRPATREKARMVIHQ